MFFALRERHAKHLFLCDWRTINLVQLTFVEHVLCEKTVSSPLILVLHDHNHWRLLFQHTNRGSESLEAKQSRPKQISKGCLRLSGFFLIDIKFISSEMHSWVLSSTWFFSHLEFCETRLPWAFSYIFGYSTPLSIIVTYHFTKCWYSNVWLLLFSGYVFSFYCVALNNLISTTSTNLDPISHLLHSYISNKQWDLFA